MDYILNTFLFLLPAGIANMSPVLFKWLPILNLPVDLGKKYNGKPIFGRNKTYRGFFVGTLMAILTVYIQKTYASGLFSDFFIDYSSVDVLVFGFLLGFGALFGDLVESFFKRRAGVGSGKPWPPFDQIDWVLGSLIFASLYVRVPIVYIVFSLLLFGLLHPVINLLGYYLGIKKNKF